MQLHVRYDGEEIKGCPINFSVQYDESKIQVTGDGLQCRVGQSYAIQVSYYPVVLILGVEVAN